jgi:hypothetical protein
MPMTNLRGCSVTALFQNVILRCEYQSGRTWSTVGEVIDAGGQLPQAWKDERGRPPRNRKAREEISPVIARQKERPEPIKTWTEEDCQKVIKMREEGVTWRECGRMYGISDQMMLKRIRAYKVEPDIVRKKSRRSLGSWNEADCENVVRMREAKITWDNCGRAYGITGKAMQKRIRKYELEHEKREVPEGLKVLTFTEMMDWKVSG